MKDIPGSKTQVLTRHRYAMPLMPHGKICDGDVAGPMGNRKEEQTGKRATSIPSCANLSTLPCCAGLSVCHGRGVYRCHAVTLSMTNIWIMLVAHLHSTTSSAR